MYEGDNKIINVSVENEMEKSYLAYSMSVIVGRALPDVRDGLKPVHRRILYTLFENGLSPDKAYRKSADTVGSVLGSYHPHGDASVYDALVRMAQDFSLRYTLVDGHGNFGSVDGDPPAAYRYTEAKLSKISMYMLTDIEKETVPFQPNYDDRLKEPVVLPSRFPNILVNGATGIAVGMATNIPPHNLGEVIDGICYLIENPDAEISQIMQFILGPDFPTGGIIMGTSGVKAAYYTGRGKIILRSKTEIEELKNGKSRIIVTEIPYMVNKSRLLESIADLVKEKRIEGISDLHDESDRDGMRIVIEIKRDANAQIVLNQLFKLTQLQDTVGVIMLALADGMPKVLNLKEIMEHYIKFQEEVITNRTNFELKKAKERAHILEGLKIAIDNIDEVIKTIKQASSISEAKEHLQARFGLTEIQAAAIVAMRLGQLTGLEREKIENELAELKLKIAELVNILENEDLILKIIKDELQQIKAKFNDKRRTQIESVYGEVDIEDLIEEHDCVVTLTRDGYIKRQPANNYKAQKRGGKGIIGLAKKEEDFISELFVCSSHDYIFFFTNKGKVYRLKCYQIPEGGRNSKGTNIINLIEIAKDEYVTAVLKVKDLQADEYLVMLTKHGVVKRTKLSVFLNIRKSGLIAINLDKDDELGWVALTNGECKVFIATKNGKALYFKESDIRCISRASRGSRGISLNADDVVVGMVAVESPEQKIITITEKGIGRCTKLSEYRLKSRGQKGILNYKTSKKTGCVVSAKAVSDDDDVMLIKNDGTIIRVAVKDISVMISRATIGVHLMRVKEDEHVVAIARAPHEDEENTQETEDNKKVD